MLLSDRHALVSDFGIAKAIRDMSDPETTATIGLTTAAGTILGTPAYMAPEQAGGETIDHRADIYGVGILAYEMLTGRLPFQATTAQQMIAAHLTKPHDLSRQGIYFRGSACRGYISPTLRGEAGEGFNETAA